MSTPTSSQDALLRATRQQLEELDALIQRMLTLPVVEAEDTALDEVAATALADVAAPVTAAQSVVPAPEGQLHLRSQDNYAQYCPPPPPHPEAEEEGILSQRRLAVTPKSKAVGCVEG